MLLRVLISDHAHVRISITISIIEISNRRFQPLRFTLPCRFCLVANLNGSKSPGLFLFRDQKWFNLRALVTFATETLN